MGFNYFDIQDTTFENLKELKEYTIVEKANIAFVPIKEYLSNNATFVEDTYFGSKMNWLNFNEEGFSQLCKKIKFPYDFVKHLKEQNLASKVLNDYIGNDFVKEILLNNQFVIDKSLSRVVGIV